ncbi:MAG: hypothetical protein MZV70_34735 [Desulfobacterales bacterium]|nr:hypothetical protein [Desulfobacterales bacterium]
MRDRQNVILTAPRRCGKKLLIWRRSGNRGRYERLCRPEILADLERLSAAIIDAFYELLSPNFIRQTKGIAALLGHLRVKFRAGIPDIAEVTIELIESKKDPVELFHAAHRPAPCPTPWAKARKNRLSPTGFGHSQLRGAGRARPDAVGIAKHQEALLHICRRPGIPHDQAVPEPRPRPSSIWQDHQAARAGHRHPLSIRAAEAEGKHLGGRGGPQGFLATLGRHPSIQ